MHAHCIIQYRQYVPITMQYWLKPSWKCIFHCILYIDTTKGFTSLTLVNKTANSLHVTWNHPYPDCKKFTVRVNGMPAVDNITSTSFTITGLMPDTEYNVTVEAMEPPLPDQSISELLMTASGATWAGKRHNNVFQLAKLSVYGLHVVELTLYGSHSSEINASVNYFICEY